MWKKKKKNPAAKVARDLHSALTLNSGSATHQLGGTLISVHHYLYL